MAVGGSFGGGFDRVEGVRGFVVDFGGGGRYGGVGGGGF